MGGLPKGCSERFSQAVDSLTGALVSLDRSQTASFRITSCKASAQISTVQESYLLCRPGLGWEKLTRCLVGPGLGSAGGFNSCWAGVCGGLRRRSSLGRSRGFAPVGLAASRPALRRQCACRRARDHNCRKDRCSRLYSRTTPAAYPPQESPPSPCSLPP